MHVNHVFFKILLCTCFCLSGILSLLAQTGQILKAPNGAEYTYHLIGNLEASNPRAIIPSGLGSCGEPGWISYAITHQLAADPQLMVACQQITNGNSLCGIMSAITMGCGYYLDCPDGHKDLKFIGQDVNYRLFVNTKLKEIYIGEFFEDNLIEVNRCRVGKKWFESDPEPYENPVTVGNPTCPKEEKLDPVAIIIANPKSGEQPLTVSFNGKESYDQDGGIITKYVWDLGEVVLYGENPTHTFDMVDSFRVRLTVTDDEGDTHSTESVIIVNPKIETKPPIARIIASPIVGTAPFQVKLDGFSSYDPDGGDIEKYQWELNGMMFSDSSEPLPYTLETPGTFTFYLTVTDDEGDTNRVSQNVMVLPPKIDTCWMMSYTIRNCSGNPDTVQRTPIRVVCPAPPQDQVLIADCCCETESSIAKKDSRFQLSGGAIFNRHRGQLSEYSIGGNIQIRYRLGEKRRMAVLIDGSVLPVRRATPLDDRPYKWSPLRDSIPDPTTNLPLVWYRGTSRGTANIGVGFELMPLPWLYAQVIGSVERTFQQEEISDPRKHPDNKFVGFDLETFFVNSRVGVRSEHLEIYLGFRALQENRPFILILQNPDGGSHHPGWDKAYEVGVSFYY